MQALNVLALDVSTACHLGVCIAVRAAEVVPMLNSTQQEDSTLFSTSQLDTALRVTGLGKKSKQRFLKASCVDNIVRRARKGAGGNTVTYTCIIVKQTAVAEDVIKTFREGGPNSVPKLMNRKMSVIMTLRVFHSAVTNTYECESNLFSIKCSN